MISRRRKQFLQLPWEGESILSKILLLSGQRYLFTGPTLVFLQYRDRPYSAILSRTRAHPAKLMLPTLYNPNARLGGLAAIRPPSSARWTPASPQIEPYHKPRVTRCELLPPQSPTSKGCRQFHTNTKVAQNAFAIPEELTLPPADIQDIIIHLPK